MHLQTKKGVGNFKHNLPTKTRLINLRYNVENLILLVSVMFQLILIGAPIVFFFIYKILLENFNKRVFYKFKSYPFKKNLIALLPCLRKLLVTIGKFLNITYKNNKGTKLIYV